GGAGGGTSCSDILLDGEFEGGTPSAVWTESSTNFGTPLCSLVTCNTTVGSSANFGNWWFWGGGATFVNGDFSEVSVATQSVVIPVGTANLTWFMEIPVCEGDGFDQFRVRVDGTTIYFADDTHFRCDMTGYFQEIVNID